MSQRSLSLPFACPVLRLWRRRRASSSAPDGGHAGGSAKRNRMSLSTLVLIAIAAGFGALYFLRSASNISSAEAHQLVANGALLVDVRTPGEFAAGHVDGAINIPVQELEGRITELGAKDRQVVLYCRSGARSGRARSLLQGEGFSAVHDLGAMSRW